MVEFTLVAPVMFLVLFGFIEFGLMMFDLGTTRFAAAEAARSEAIVGSFQSQVCDAPCQVMFPGKPTCDADCRAIVAIHATALGSTTLQHVWEIDVQQYQDVGGSIVPVMCNGSRGPQICQNQYNLDGTSVGTLSVPPASTWVPSQPQTYSTDVSCPSTNYSWPTSCRNVTYGHQDYLNVFIRYEYQWKTGLYSAFPFPQLNAGYLVRLEPQKF
jgi:Flp pilus assembly protein TadG